MLKILRGGQRWLTALFIFAIGGVFVFFLGLGGPLSGRSQGTVVEVGPYHFGVIEFERMRQRYEFGLQQQMGDAYDARAVSDQLDGLTVRGLVDTALLALAAEDFGLTVTKHEIEQIVLSGPSFRDSSGGFDRAQFEDWVNYEYGSERSFLDDQHMHLLADKMRQLLLQSSSVSDAEVREAVRDELEEVRIAFVALGGDTGPPETDAIEPAAVEHAVATRGAELEQLYAARRDRYDIPEQVRARDILIRADRKSDPKTLEARRAVAQKLRDRLAAGEDFAELARKDSDDAKTRERGGDLGFFRRGQLAPELEKAAFGLDPGQLSEVIQTDSGFHIMRVEERRDAAVRGFEDVREELARELLTSEARHEAAQRAADALAAAIRGGSSLEDAARAQKINVHHSDALTRRTASSVPGLGAAPELMATAFALAPGESSPRIFDVGDKLALVQLLERSEPDQAAIQAHLDEVRDRLESAKRDLRADDWLDAIRRRVVDAGDLHVDLDALGRR
jgi:peptidyl-prolyl cis-trans isomerase D